MKPVFDTLHRDPGLRALYTGLGNALLQLVDVSGARAAFEQALGLVERLAAQLEDEELKSSFLTSPLVWEIQTGLAAEVP